MKIILLSGGSGKRLWPLSNEARSKQFLKLLQNDNGEYESMVQRVYRQLKAIIPEAEVIVATGENQKDSIKNQLGANINIVFEPERRDTYPAILLAAAYLAFKKKINVEETIIVLPVDPYAEEEYFSLLFQMDQIIQRNQAELVLMGIKPTYPSEKYGYIIGEKRSSDIYQVKSFREKPKLEEAKNLLRIGAFWNGGVFAFKLGYIIDILRRDMDVNTFEEVQNNYVKLKKISFDYAVVEQAENIAMVSYKGYWKDLGTWNTLTEEMTEQYLGQVITGENLKNTHIINELDIPVVALGTQNLVIVSSPDGILVSDKERSSYMKPYVDTLNERPMYEERQWGDYKVLDYVQYKDGTKSLTKHIFIKQDKKIKSQIHALRDEILTVVNGRAEIIIDGERKQVRDGDAISIKRGQEHSILAITDLHILEVQLGMELYEMDNIKNNK